MKRIQSSLEEIDAKKGEEMSEKNYEINRISREGKQCFVIVFLKEDSSSIINPNNYKIVEATIETISLPKQTATVYFDLDSKEIHEEVKLQHLAKSKIEAEQRIREIVYWLIINRICEGLQNANLPDAILKPNFEVHTSGNPLRFGERNIAFGAQTNVFGSEVNAQKIIQMLAVTLEDIEVLLSILEIIQFANDYAKRIVGKFLIVEFNNIYTLLKSLADINEDYSRNLFMDFDRNIQQLETQHDLRGIRNSLAAHKSPDLDLTDYVDFWKKVNRKVLQEYWALIVQHLDKMLNRYYPMEKKLYFLIRREPIKGFVATERIEGYEPFGEFEL